MGKPSATKYIRIKSQEELDNLRDNGYYGINGGFILKGMTYYCLEVQRFQATAQGDCWYKQIATDINTSRCIYRVSAGGDWKNWMEVSTLDIGA